MNTKRIAEYLDRAEGVSAWHIIHQHREQTTVIRLPGIYSVRDGRLAVEPNPHPREVITAPSESVYAWLFSEFAADGGDWRGDAVGQFTGDDETSLAVVAGLVASARSQKNRPFPLPGADEEYPDVPLADLGIAGLEHPALLAKAQAFIDAIVAETARLDRVDVSNVELFITRQRSSFRSSAGAALDYPATRFSAEVCFLARPEGDRVGEHTARLSARRLADLNPAAIVAEYGTAARDIALAGAPPTFQGAVVLTGEAAADFLALGTSPLVFHANARSVHEKTSRHEAGKPVHAGELKGEPLNLVSDPLVPFGLASALHSQVDGGAARRVTIARDGNWDGLLGGRRYYHYLGLLDRGIAAPGQPGNTVITAGPTPVGDLLCGDDETVVVRAFSAFEVDASSGQFSVEIRLGEIRRGGDALPFTSGLLVGNWFEAVADANYSAETQALGAYRGPLAVRFNNLKVAG